MKPVLLIVIDALSSRVVHPAMQAGRLSTLKELGERGHLQWNCTSVFPSITPAATASIITGCYPGDHGVTGAYFYDRQDRRVFYFGADVPIIWREGFDKFFEDFVVGLNETRLQCPTLFDWLSRHGRTAASLNYLVFHGPRRHRVQTPWLMRLWPGVPFREDIEGPEILFLGDMVREGWEGAGNVSTRSGMFHHYGFEDHNTADFLAHLAASERMPDLTVAYFPQNDFQSHKLGPANAIETLAYVDHRLQEFFAAQGGMKSFLDRFAVVVTGDHSQSDVLADADEAGIQLRKVLHEFDVADVGPQWSSDADLLICPNLRSAQIYWRGEDQATHDRIVECLLGEPRIDQVMWREAASSGDVYCVRTAHRGELRYWASDDGHADDYGNRWRWNGSLDTIDARAAAGRLSFGDYPNAMERIANVFDRRVTGDLWCTARLGYEFCVWTSEVHAGGGSHSSLHRDDSTSPLITAGLPEHVALPSCPRTIDVARLCCECLEVSWPGRTDEI